MIPRLVRPVDRKPFQMPLHNYTNSPVTLNLKKKMYGIWDVLMALKMLSTNIVSISGFNEWGHLKQYCDKIISYWFNDNGVFAAAPCGLAQVC